MSTRSSSSPLAGLVLGTFLATLIWTLFTASPIPLVVGGCYLVFTLLLAYITLRLRL